ncbi:MAG TPA: class I tRNA ligase family protein, partial [Candidatus Saccharimonadaceae bacterium]|nr:class I tRNA ligase family protein [Candidatus Saccharimonadaceae bacterium]
MRRYNPTEIEPKWQQIWRDDQRYKAPDNSDKPKYYVTGMFPYPSGAGMHTGHFFEHSIVDANARFHRALGENVMYPMGFDNFGLPAENYAIKTGVSPQKATADNIANFKNQLNRVGASIDWSREVQTSDPSYYKWTQWVFTKLFERGLAYQKESLQWWCPIDQTVLANEQVVNGKCWRHDGPDDPPAEKKSIKQWFFKITDYADALLEEIPDLDWPDKIKTAQTNWIGRSVGAEITFEVCHSQSEGSSSDTETRSTQSVVRHSRPDRESSKEQSTHDDWILSQAQDDDREKITVFSTRPDTIFGATFLVLAPEHPLIRALATDDTRETVEAYIDAAIKKSEIDRTNDTKDKTGVFTGSYAVNPASGEKIPIWVADYVLWGYGTGAVMGVPAHDQRDYEFATKFELPITQVVSSYVVREDDLAPRDDWPTREKEVIDAIITDGKGNYLLQIETFPDGTKDVHFVGGGVDDSDESVEAAVRREVVEEVGYTNITSFRLAAPFNAAFVQRKLRKRNHRTWGAFYEVVVDPTVQVKSEIDDGRHEIMWVPKKDVEKSITKDWGHHKKGWQDYLDGRTVDIEVREGILVNS